MDVWTIILSVLAYIFIALIVLRLLLSLYRIIVPFFLWPRVNLHAKAGAKWAVVTGSTDGIGKAYAFELASKKFNIFLVSRTQSKLDETKQEMETMYPEIEVLTYSFDFTTPTAEEYEPLISELSKLEVGILVNNVGIAPACPEVLHEVDGGRQAIARMNACNSMPVMMLCSVVLEQMVPRKKGVIINIASSAGMTEMAYWNIYSAGKKFIIHLSSILEQEYSSYGITVQCVAPMGVATKLLIIDIPSFFTPSAQAFARSALRTVGITSLTTGYFSHQMQAEGLGLLPTWLGNKMMKFINSRIRADIHRKRAQGIAEDDQTGKCNSRENLYS